MPLEALGKKLEDHSIFWLSGFSVNDSTIFQKINSSETEKSLEDFHNGTGILTLTVSGCHSFIVSSKAEPDWPDLRIDLNSQVGIDEQELGLGFIIVLGRPKSKGILTLDTDKYKAGIRDDAQLAVIDYQLLTHPDDIDVILEGKAKVTLCCLSVPAFHNYFRHQISFQDCRDAGF